METWLKSRCLELEETVVALQRQVETLKAEHASNVAAHVASARHSEHRVGALMAELDDLRAQLKVIGHWMASQWEKCRAATYDLTTKFNILPLTYWI